MELFSRRQFVFLYCLLYALILNLVFVQYSVATWSPHRHPLQQAAVLGTTTTTTTTTRLSTSSRWWGVLELLQDDEDDIDPVRRSIQRYRRRWNDDVPPRGGSTTMHPDEIEQLQLLQQQQQYYDKHQSQQVPQHEPYPSTQDSAIATPVDHQQHQHQQQQQLQQDQFYDSSQSLQEQQQPLPPQQQQQHQEEDFVPPEVQLKHVSMALRLTSEWNRRLMDGIHRFNNWGKGRHSALVQHNYQQQQQQQQQQQLQEPPPLQSQEYVEQPYGQQPVNVHPSRAWHPPIHERSFPLEVDNTERDLTVFHADRPCALEDEDVNDSAGVRYWGPDLEMYLDDLVELLGLSSSPINKQNYHDASGAGTANSNSNHHNHNFIELPLAMIYLDRACSVETPRTLFQGYGNGATVAGGMVVPPCPFCSPRTVHRLSLAALLLAMEAVHGTHRMEEACARILEEQSSSTSTTLSTDLSKEQLIQMVRWMKAALGDAGLVVTEDQMKEWSQSWEVIFGSKRSEDEE